jgi:hypothetical protein
MAVVGDDRILDVLDGLKRAGRTLGRLGDILSSDRGSAWSLSDRMVASAN